MEWIPVQMNHLTVKNAIKSNPYLPPPPPRKNTNKQNKNKNKQNTQVVAIEVSSPDRHSHRIWSPAIQIRLKGEGGGKGVGPNSPAMITPMRKGNIGQEAGICERCNNEKATHQTMDVYSPLSITFLYTLFNAHRICFRGVFNALYNWSWGRGDGNRWGGLKVPPWYEGTHVRVVREHFISDEFAKQEG